MAHAGPCGCNPPRRQLQGPLGPPGRLHQTVWTYSLRRSHHPASTIEEKDVDRKPHAHGVDGPARLEEHGLTLGKRGSPKESPEALQNSFRLKDPIGQPLVR